MTGRIYFLAEEGGLRAMDEAKYEAEELLQSLLADYPDLLAGEQINSDVPRHWILIQREVGVPGSEGGGSRWALDHLFLDQDAIPTLVEVKRSTDTRSRREVVAQMLDYAANAVSYWPVDQLHESYLRRCETQGLDPQEVLSAVLEPGSDEEEFWQRVKTNLWAGRVRMVFVADEIPRELQRIVEFLNEQMDPAEVLAVEVRQYVGEGGKALVPRVIGQTAQAQERKSVGPQTRWDEEAFFADLTDRRSAQEVEAARTIYDWAQERGARIDWGIGKLHGSFAVRFDQGGVRHHTFALYSNGRIEMQFATMHRSPPFDNLEQRLRLLERFNQVLGVVIGEDDLDSYPSVALADLANQGGPSGFLEVWDWYVSEIKAANP